MSGEPWTVTDSTYFVRRNNQGELLSKVLIRAERHIHGGEYREHKEDKEEFLSDTHCNQRLSALGLSLASPVHDYRPCGISCNDWGVVLIKGNDSLALVPLETLVKSIPGYHGARLLNVYSGPSAYYLHVQEDCMDVAEDCRQVILPISRAEFQDVRSRLVHRQTIRK